MNEKGLNSAIIELITAQVRGQHGYPVRLENHVPGSSRPQSLILSAVGGGGKTSLLYLLAERLAGEGLRVCITTTTHMYDPRTEANPHQFDKVLIIPEWGDAPASLEAPASLASSTLKPLDELGAYPKPGSITIVAARDGLPDHSNHVQESPLKPLLKLKGIHPAWVTLLKDHWDVVLVEADGSKHLPVKAPAEHEPVIPSHANIVLGCIGLDCLGKPLEERFVHRPSLFSLVTGCRAGEPIMVQHLINLILHPEGLFKASPERAQRIVVLNKADLLREEILWELEELFGTLFTKEPLTVLIGSVRSDRLYGRRMV
jgi:probable selenium-dependent hydroxylase accessory protein YqeC